MTSAGVAVLLVAAVVGLAGPVGAVVGWPAGVDNAVQAGRGDTSVGPVNSLSAGSNPAFLCAPGYAGGLALGYHARKEVIVAGPYYAGGGFVRDRARETGASAVAAIPVSRDVVVGILASGQRITASSGRLAYVNYGWGRNAFGGNTDQTDEAVTGGALVGCRLGAWGLGLGAGLTNWRTRYTRTQVDRWLGTSGTWSEWNGRYGGESNDTRPVATLGASRAWAHGLVACSVLYAKDVNYVGDAWSYGEVRAGGTYTVGPVSGMGEYEGQFERGLRDPGHHGHLGIEIAPLPAVTVRGGAVYYARLRQGERWSAGYGFLYGPPAQRWEYALGGTVAVGGFHADVAWRIGRYQADTLILGVSYQI